MQPNISQELPVWYQPEAPIGSAVRYIASICAHARGVEFLGNRRKAALGDCSGSPAWVAASSAGEFRIHLHPHCELSPVERAAVVRVAVELGGLWQPRK